MELGNRLPLWDMIQCTKWQDLVPQVVHALPAVCCLSCCTANRLFHYISTESGRSADEICIFSLLVSVHSVSSLHLSMLRFLEGRADYFFELTVSLCLGNCQPSAAWQLDFGCFCLIGMSVKFCWLIYCTTTFYLLPCYVLRMGYALLSFVVKKFELIYVSYWPALCEPKFLPPCLHYTSIAVYWDFLFWPAWTASVLLTQVANLCWC